MNNRRLRILLALLLIGASPLTIAAQATPTASFQCQPTPEDEMGPFYRPGAPLRSVIGTGYLLTGTVKSAVDCAPIAGPLIEFWLAAPNGRYEESHRAAIITGEAGSYRLETDAPPEYFSRPSHIHIRVSAKGFQTLVTQHYLEPGDSSARFDLVLVPEP
jgi:catechol 1,2-dioxygenase